MNIFLNTFKDKIYWILLLPFLTILVFLSIFIGDSNTKAFLILGFIDVSLFWLTYYLWKYFSNKKRGSIKDDSHV
ncbi:hypothetical protein FFL34_00955 [Lentibacillus cibarius]|uniref:Uncharacterized protein n=1 Tax=Lentibacillus cibarius TaxID=2583219 RepID=A0A5S3QK81_9BACI|nr:hypothetical protein FFL34_00955 [Lentibacillus cibarius]